MSVVVEESIGPKKVWKTWERLKRQRESGTKILYNFRFFKWEEGHTQKIGFLSMLEDSIQYAGIARVFSHVIFCETLLFSQNHILRMIIRHSKHTSHGRYF